MGAVFGLIEKEKALRWLNEQGIAAFVLKYSHGGWAAFVFHVRMAGRKFPASFNDLSRALEYVKTHAKEYGINFDRVGCMGFSVGGHLVMHAAEQLTGNAALVSFL